MNGDLQLQLGQVFQFLIGLVLLGGSIFISARILVGLRRDGGNVSVCTSGRDGEEGSVSPFGPPDLLIVLVMGSFFIWATISGMARHAASEELPHLSSILFNSAFLFVIDFGIAAFLVSRRLQLRSLFGFDRFHFGRVFGLAALSLVIAFPLVMLANVTEMQFLKDGGEAQALVKLFQQGAAADNRSIIMGIVVAGVFIAPILEEFLFRGYFYGVLKRSIGPIGAAVISAALFAFIHGNIASLAGLFTLALALTVAYERTGSLAVPMGMHALFNLSNLCVLYFTARTGSA